MKRIEPKQIGEIIREAIEHEGLADAIAEKRACYEWPEVVGPGVNRYTSRRYVERGVMHVSLTSSVLKNELSYYKSSLVEKLNRAAGKNVITSIEFH